MNNNYLYADVILPLAITELYTYLIPDELKESLKIGMRVIVPLGQRKLYTAIVYKIHANTPEFESIKNISEIVDIKAIVRDSQFRLWEWISDYYLTTMGEVLKSALPGGLKLESESRIILNETYEKLEDLSERQSLIWKFLKKR